jgi:hypothetical protein
LSGCPINGSSGRAQLLKLSSKLRKRERRSIDIRQELNKAMRIGKKCKHIL